ncbi:hypothetical protein BJY01DRAFT_248781 [Aspergillus pseudoustus]|uniref:Uncharacterized protein n=1 Tax=Aspergillus pseudoustus TaxID=1810923 RepID=A0ABR4JSX0_9EURO
MSSEQSPACPETRTRHHHNQMRTPRIAIRNALVILLPRLPSIALQQTLQRMDDAVLPVQHRKDRVVPARSVCGGFESTRATCNGPGTRAARLEVLESRGRTEHLADEVRVVLYCHMARYSFAKNTWMDGGHQGVDGFIRWIHPHYHSQSRVGGGGGDVYSLTIRTVPVTTDNPHTGRCTRLLEYLDRPLRIRPVPHPRGAPRHVFVSMGLSVSSQITV